MSLTHRATPDFWFSYRNLPESVQKIADKNYALMQENPRHPSLQLKKVGYLWSARVSLNHRALAADDEGELVWFWIGTHAEYERMI
jgi:hypothetical protein